MEHAEAGWLSASSRKENNWHERVLCGWAKNRDCPRRAGSEKPVAESDVMSRLPVASPLLIEGAACFGARAESGSRPVHRRRRDPPERLPGGHFVAGRSAPTSEAALAYGVRRWLSIHQTLAGGLASVASVRPGYRRPGPWASSFEQGSSGALQQAGPLGPSVIARKQVRHCTAESLPASLSAGGWAGRPAGGRKRSESKAPIRARKGIRRSHGTPLDTAP